MAAAWELGKAGFDCTVLEARARTGGRVWTVRKGDKIEMTDGSRQVCAWDEGQYMNAGRRAPAQPPPDRPGLLPRTGRAAGGRGQFQPQRLPAQSRGQRRSADPHADGDQRHAGPRLRIAWPRRSTRARWTGWRTRRGRSAEVRRLRWKMFRVRIISVVPARRVRDVAAVHGRTSAVPGRRCGPSQRRSSLLMWRSGRRRSAFPTGCSSAPASSGSWARTSRRSTAAPGSTTGSRRPRPRSSCAARWRACRWGCSCRATWRRR